MKLRFVWTIHSLFIELANEAAPGFGSEESFEVVAAVVGAVDD